MANIKFRNDKFYGNGGHSPEEILAYECLNLGNIYILEDLLARVEKHLSKVELADINWVLEAVKKGIIKSNDESMDYTPYVCVFNFIINALEKELGMNIQTLIWLGDLETILENYSEEDCNYLEEFDAYETGKLIYEVPCDGNLYAYENKPKPLSKSVVKEALDQTDGLYKVYVYPGFGYQLQEIYFNHSNISIEEIAAYCVINNVGWTIDTDDFEFDENDERFVYVDLSSKSLDNCWLCIDNMRCDDDAEIIS